MRHHLTSTDVSQLERRLAVQPNEVKGETVQPPEPKDLATYIDVANSAMQKVEALEREVAMVCEYLLQALTSSSEQ